MQLFYYKDIDRNTESFTFDKEESRHIIKVLRKKENDILHVTNGDGILFTTRIIFPGDNRCTVEVVEVKETSRPPYKLHLAVAPTKMNERFEWFLEKATEIGISEITPIICEHSERKSIKNERFDKIILAAMKQSKQMFLPLLNEAVNYKEFVSTPKRGQRFIAHCEETNKQSLADSIERNSDVLIMIGPEGDFSEKEIEIALTNNFLPVSLGNTRLRTETAAVVACHTVVLINELQS
jgi:16S rRNA (uracil1498-N3)-methyltransferase